MPLRKPELASSRRIATLRRSKPPWPNSQYKPQDIRWKRVLPVQYRVALWGASLSCILTWHCSNHFCSSSLLPPSIGRYPRFSLPTKPTWTSPSWLMMFWMRHLRKRPLMTNGQTSR